MSKNITSAALPVTESTAVNSSDFPMSLYLAAAESTGEQVATMLYIGLAGMLILAGNGIFILTVLRHVTLQTPHFVLLCAYSTADIITCLFGFSFVLVVLILDSDVPEWLCRTSGTVAVASFFASLYTLSLIAFERYHYFRYPMSYARYFDRRNLTCVLIVIWLIPFGFTITTEVILERRLYIAVLGCQLIYSKLISQIQAVLFFAPSMCLTTYCLLRLAALRTHLHSKIVPRVQISYIDTASPAQARQPVDIGRLALRKAGTSIRLILLVSGLFWSTYFPGFIIRLTLFSSGISWEDIESRENLTAMVLLRVSHFVMTTVSPMLNPFIYLYTHRQLRLILRAESGRHAS